MTLGIGIQGNDWAVLAADGLIGTGLRSGPAKLRYEKIKSWGAGVYAMFAGSGYAADHPLLAWMHEKGEAAKRVEVTVASPEECVEKVWEYMQAEHDQIERDHGKTLLGPQALILVSTTSPTIFRATKERGIERAEPGRILSVPLWTDELPVITADPGDESAGRVKAASWLKAVIDSGWKDSADFPLTIVSVGPTGPTLVRIEESDLKDKGAT